MSQSGSRYHGCLILVLAYIVAVVSLTTSIVASQRTCIYWLRVSVLQIFNLLMDCLPKAVADVLNGDSGVTGLSVSQSGLIFVGNVGLRAGLSHAAGPRLGIDKPLRVRYSNVQYEA